MKRHCYIHILSCIVVAMTIFAPHAAVAGDLRHTIKFDTSKAIVSKKAIENGETYCVVNWPGMSSTAKISEPDLPVQYIRLLVPTCSTDFKVRVVSTAEDKRIGIDHKVYPAQEPQIPGQPTEFRKATGSGYSAATPKITAGVVEENMFEGKYHVVTVGVSPVLYEPQQSRLTLYDEMTLSVEYRECEETEMALEVDYNIRPSRHFRITDIVDNPEYGIGKGLIRAVQEEDYVEDHYVIVAPQDLCENLKDLATWKRQKGYKVTIKPIEEILQDPAYKANGTAGREDEASSLRAYLADYYRNIGGHYFCLLVGDHKTNMPIRYAMPMLNDKQGSGFLTPTDSYFENVTGNWRTYLIKEYSDNYFIDEMQFLIPRITIGRLLCHNTEQVENYLYKLFLYESNPGRGNRDYLNTMFFFEQDANDSMIGEAEIVLTQAFPNSKFNSISNIVLYQDQRRATPPVDWPHGKDVIAQMRQSGISSWHGHGEPTNTAVMAGIDGYGKSWRFITAREEYTSYDMTCNGKIELIKEDGDGLNTLYNDDYPSIVYSIACNNVPYDIYDDDSRHYDVPYNMGSSFTVGGRYGGPAFLGNTRYGVSPYSCEMESYFFKSISTNTKIGIAENYSKISYPVNVMHNKHTHQLIGDPEFNIWLDKPANLNISAVYSGKYLYLIGEDQINSQLFMSDGDKDVISYSPKSTSLSLFDTANSNKIVSPILMYGIWKIGFLPEINLVTRKGESKDKTLNFVVRNAVLGTNDSNSNNNYIICGATHLSIRAIDKIETTAGFMIKESAEVILNCDMDVLLNGMEIDGSSKLTVNAKNIRLNSGFMAKKGVKIKINNSIL